MILGWMFIPICLGHLVKVVCRVIQCPQRLAWMREWAFFGCVNAWKSKKNCVNAWIEKTCVNVKIQFSVAWMRESALFFVWTREFSLFTQICANFPDFWHFSRFFPKISPISRKIGFAWISRKTCVNAWISKIFLRECVNFGSAGGPPYKLRYAT